MYMDLMAYIRSCIGSFLFSISTAHLYAVANNKDSKQITPDSTHLSVVAVEDRGGEVGGAAVVLGADGAVVLGDDLAGGDGVAVGDVAARVEGVPDGEVEAALGRGGGRPGVGDVVRARAVLDVGELVGALEEGAAVARGQDGVRDDGEVVAGERVSWDDCGLLGSEATYEQKVL